MVYVLSAEVLLYWTQSLGFGVELFFFFSCENMLDLDHFWMQLLQQYQLLCSDTDTLARDGSAPILTFRPLSWAGQWEPGGPGLSQLLESRSSRAVGARLAQCCRFLGQGRCVGYMQQARSEGCHAGETCQRSRDKWRLTSLQLKGKQKPAGRVWAWAAEAGLRVLPVITRLSRL